MRSDAPAEVVAIYQKLMAKEPADRYQKASELVEALAPFVSSKGNTAVTSAPPSLPPVSEPVFSGTTVVAATIPHVPQTESAVVAPPVSPSAGNGRRWTPMHWTIAAGGAAAVLLLGVIIITITNKDGTKTKVEVSGDAKQIEVTQDGKTLVKVHPEDLPRPVMTTPTAPVELPTDYAAERKVAEWLAKTIEGQSFFQLLNTQGEAIVITPDSRRLPDGDFVVHGFHLEGPSYDDAGFANLAGCRRLQSGQLFYNTVLTAKGLRHLTSSIRLRSLGIWGCPAIDGAVIPLLAKWKELSELVLDGCPLSSEALASWPPMPQLLALNLNDMTLNEEGLRSIIRQSPNVESISVSKPNNDPSAAMGVIDIDITAETSFCRL